MPTVSHPLPIRPLSRSIPAAVLALACGFAPVLQADELTVTVEASAPAKSISPDLFGIFFEDLSYAADGGLYAELVQNRSFEYQATEQLTWTPLTSWQLEQRGGGKGTWEVEDADPIHAHNPHYLLLKINQVGEGVGVSNEGFDGIAVREGETYDASFFARNIESANKPMPVAVRLETKGGQCLGEASLEVKGRSWTKWSASIKASGTDENARLVWLAKGKGSLALDEVSLFPHQTFHDRANGLRADLAQTIADLHPKFVRFPGGCLAHGDGIGNIYRWKETIGPVEQRRGQKNIWRYHQSVGLGYFEYFQFCEDIGAKPLPVIAAGVSCQGTERYWPASQRAVPMKDMPAFIQDILDLVEWANGPASSPWGSVRAQAGHPEPFHLEYLGIGNEDEISPEFKERFRMIREALGKAHPEIKIVGTAGPSPSGRNFDEGWKLARELKIALVDEHYYKDPEWFLDNLNRYDTYDRQGPKVYVGEYAAQEKNRHNTLRSAIAEAAYLTSLERNGDVVGLSSYAPLLANAKHTHWKPDLIYFTNTKIAPSVNYYVQQLFGTNSGDALYSTTLSEPAQGVAVSAVRESQTGDLILKLVNPNPEPKPLKVVLSGAQKLPATAVKTVLAGNPLAENTFETTAPLLPRKGQLPVGDSFRYEAPGTSLTVIRITPKR